MTQLPWERHSAVVMAHKPTTAFADSVINNLNNYSIYLKASRLITYRSPSLPAPGPCHPSRGIDKSVNILSVPHGANILRYRRACRQVRTLWMATLSLKSMETWRNALCWRRDSGNFHTAVWFMMAGFDDLTPGSSDILWFKARGGGGKTRNSLKKSAASRYLEEKAPKTVSLLWKHPSR